MGVSINEYNSLVGKKNRLIVPFLALKCRLLWPHFNATVLIRKMHNTKCGLYKIILKRRLLTKYSMEVPEKAIIGKCFRIMHLSGIVIGTGCVIGDNCTIYQGVVLGTKELASDDEFPQIGNNVTIYSGAKILGNVKVGDGAIIGANAVVIEDVPAGGVAVGCPARIVRINQ